MSKIYFWKYRLYSTFRTAFGSLETQWAYVDLWDKYGPHPSARRPLGRVGLN